MPLDFHMSRVVHVQGGTWQGSTCPGCTWQGVHTPPYASHHSSLGTPSSSRHPAPLSGTLYPSMEQVLLTEITLGLAEIRVLFPLLHSEIFCSRWITSQKSTKSHIILVQRVMLNNSDTLLSTRVSPRRHHVQDHTSPPRPAKVNLDTQTRARESEELPEERRKVEKSRKVRNSGK